MSTDLEGAAWFDPLARPLLTCVILHLRPELNRVAVGAAVERIALRAETAGEPAAFWAEVQAALDGLETGAHPA